jgi:CRISPR-associated protein Csd2
MNRYDFAFLFDVQDGNPNGDPDAGNLPRVDPETGHGLVTDVCLKRKVRNYVAMKMGNKAPHEIYFTDGAVLNQKHEQAYQSIGEKPSDKLPKEAAKARALTDFMCRNFFDIRAFGAVMSTGVNCGQVRGPIQVSFARSVDPVVTSEHAITRNSVTNAKDLEFKTREMGRKFTIPYGLYRCHGFVNPFLAEQTGFGPEDLELLWEALANAFQFDQSAARPAGSMNTRRLVVFEHESPLGNAPSHRLFESITIRRRDTVVAARAFGDYQVLLDSASVPRGVRVIEKLAE